MRIIVILFICCALNVKGQDSLKFQVQSSSKLEITKCKYYVSHLTYYKKGVQMNVDSSAHLIQSLDTSILVGLKLQEADSVSFLLGIDSLHNVEGVFGGELDPTNGMYWAWQSGFINVKLEGLYLVSNEKIELHLGGYMSPFVSAQKVGLGLTSNVIQIDLQALISFIIENEYYTVMSPGQKALDCSVKIVEGIRCKAE